MSLRCVEHQRNWVETWWYVKNGELWLEKVTGFLPSQLSVPFEQPSELHPLGIYLFKSFNRETWATIVKNTLPQSGRLASSWWHSLKNKGKKEIDFKAF